MSNLTIEIGRGMARDVVLQARDGNGNAFAPVTNPTPFLITDTLTGKVWAGDQTVSLLSPVVSWSDVTIGTVLTSFANADTATLALGTYRYQITATRGAKTAPIIECRLRVTPTPGTQTTGKAYTVINDLLRYAPWIEDLQSDRQEAGFAEEQYRATEDLIQVLVRLWPGGGGGLQLGQQGFNAASFGGNIPSKYLRDLIAPVAVDGTHPANVGNANVYSGLIIREITKEYCAKKAISYVCAAQIGRTSERNFQALANFFRRDAEALLKTYVAEIDAGIPQTGYASITVNCGGGQLV